MEIKLKLNKSVNDNANIYFEKSKKLKSKLSGIEKIIFKTKKEIVEFEKHKELYLKKKEKDKKIKTHKKSVWYDKFRYTTTSNGFLVVIGKDSGTNEILIKKHMEEDDIVMHTESPGSPFGLLKKGLKKAPKEDIEEAMQFVACFSKQWTRGFGNAEVFWVEPKQVSKKANTGEYIAKGGFMIRGEKNINKNIQTRICLGIKKETIETKNEEGEIENIETDILFSGSEKACKKYCGSRYIKIEPGNDNYKALTKEIKKRLKIQYLEDLPKFIPNNCKILKK